MITPRVIWERTLTGSGPAGSMPGQRMTQHDIIRTTDPNKMSRKQRSALDSRIERKAKKGRPGKPF